jgi:hypothetical protein
VLVPATYIHGCINIYMDACLQLVKGVLKVSRGSTPGQRRLKRLQGVRCERLRECVSYIQTSVCIYMYVCTDEFHECIRGVSAASTLE